MHVNSSMYTLMATMEVQPEVVFPIPFWDLQLCTTVPVFGHMYGTVPCDTIIGKLTGIYLLPIHQGLIITVAKFGQPTIIIAPPELITHCSPLTLIAHFYPTFSRSSSTSKP